MKFLFQKKYLVLLLLSLTLNLSTIVYLPTIYYIPFQQLFGLTNEQQGTLLSVYGTLSFFAYFFGGLIADRIGVKTLLVWSSIITGCLALYTSTVPSYEIMLVIYVLYAISFIFLQWPAFMKAVRMLGASEEMPRINAFWGFTSNMFGMVLSYGLLFIFADAVNGAGGFEWVIVTYATISIAIGVSIQLFYKPDEFLTKEAREELEGTKKKGGIDFSLMGKVLKTPSTWFSALLILTGYMTTTAASYFSVMLNSVYLLPVSITVAMGIAIKYVFRSISGPMAAVIIEKLGVSHKAVKLFSSVIISVLLGMIFLPVDPAIGTIALILVALFSFVIGFSGSAGMLPLAETKVPMMVYGTTAGIVSALGYSSDMWLFSVLGGVLDADPTGGFKTIMWILLGAQIVMLVTAFVYGQYLNKLIKQDPEKYTPKKVSTTEIA